MSRCEDHGYDEQLRGFVRLILLIASRPMMMHAGTPSISETSIKFRTGRAALSDGKEKTLSSSTVQNIGSALYSRRFWWCLTLAFWALFV